MWEMRNFKIIIKTIFSINTHSNYVKLGMSYLWRVIY